MYVSINTGDELLLLERQPRILVVDEHAGVREGVRRALEPKHSVTCEPSARAALSRIARGEQFELILCDLHLPGMSGLQLLEELDERSPVHIERTVLMAQGEVDPTTLSAARKFGVPLIDKRFDQAFLRNLAGWYAG